MSGIRGKPPLLYRYAFSGAKILVGVSKSRARDTTWSYNRETPAPTPEQKARWKLKQQAAAAQNLHSMPRPLKPPQRRTP